MVAFWGLELSFGALVSVWVGGSTQKGEESLGSRTEVARGDKLTGTAGVKIGRSLDTACWFLRGPWRSSGPGPPSKVTATPTGEETVRESQEFLGFICLR